MKEMQTMGPTELLEETTDFLGACLKARKKCLFLNHKIGDGDCRYIIKQYE